MQYKNDNLEDLFREAANDYPLRTDNSNWDSVASRLNNFATSDPVAVDKSVAAKSNVWKYAAILLLFLGAGALIYFSQNNTDKTSFKADTSGIQKNNQQNNQQQPSQSITNSNPGFAPSQDANAITKENSGNNNQVNLFKTPSLKNSPATDYSMLQKNENGINSVKDNYTGQQSLSSTLNQDNISNNQSFEKQQEQVISGNDPATGNSIIANPGQEAPNANPDNQLSTLSKKDVITYNAPLSKFYGSLYGGPQFSMVKAQHIAKSGYKVGIALAYRMNKRFDVEVGAQREEINYFTQGKYFDKSGLKLKETTALEDLTANSLLTTVPITVRYNFQSKKKGHFYVGLGTDALVLTHAEKYQYTTLRNGTSNDKFKNYKSVTSAKYFTNINASAGYQNKLCNWCDYKIEPYYQIPVKNLGVGKLPITKFGLNIGIVKDLNLK